MFRFIESIALDHGIFKNIELHQHRIRETLNQFFPGSSIELDNELLSNFPEDGYYKCRIVYSDTIETIEFIPYTIRGTQALKVVVDNSIDYSFKFHNRERINYLFQQREDCDDILIVKNGFVTDSSYSNIIFFDGKRWVTSDTPLLNGIMRRHLLHMKKIFETRITIDDLQQFQSFKLINSLVGLNGPEIDVSRIVL